MATPTRALSLYPNADPDAYDPNKLGPFGMPIGVGNPNPPPAPAAPAAPGLKSMQLLAPIQSGLAAGGSVQPTTDAGEAVLDTAMAGLGGAASGMAVGAAMGAGGGPVGAAVGGAIGLVAGGLKAYLGLKKARKTQRKNDAIARAIEAKEEARHQETRNDNLRAERYNKRQNALQSMWNAQQTAMARINEIMANDQNAKAMFLKLGR
jgi:hypothetical protein